MHTSKGMNSTLMHVCVSTCTICLLLCRIDDGVADAQTDFREAQGPFFLTENKSCAYTTLTLFVFAQCIQWQGTIKTAKLV